MKKNITRIILAILLLGTFYIIFGFSGQDGEESSGLSRKETEFITDNIFQLSNESKIHCIDQLEYIIRKLAHFSIYTVVGILLMGFVSTYEIEKIKKIYISIVVGIIYATSDEIHQAFIPDRSARLTDVIIDTMGIVLGIIIVLIFMKLVYKRIHNAVE